MLINYFLYKLTAKSVQTALTLNYKYYTIYIEINEKFDKLAETSFWYFSIINYASKILIR